MSWTSVYFLGDDNIVETKMESIEVYLLEDNFHLPPEEAEKDVKLINPRTKQKEHS
jgi:hypothetical protein